MKRAIVILTTIIILFFALNDYAASKEKIRKTGKNWLRASLETFGLNLSLAVYNSYHNWKGRTPHLTDFSLKTVYSNLKKGYVWDYQYYNSFQCNQLDHPYHGMIHFSLGRLNGLDFWESAIIAAQGSFTWEALIENAFLNEQPSVNDTLMNVLGGATLGELLLKLASLAQDNSASGIERGFREVLTFFINPVVGINRVITGQTFKVNGFSEKHYSDLNIFFNSQSRLGINVSYKDALTKKEEIEPYDYFSFEFRGKLSKNGIKNERTVSNGFLFGRRSRYLFGTTLFGLFADFDYYNASFSKVSAVGAGPGLVVYANLGPRVLLVGSASLSLVFGGASSFRNYQGPSFSKNKGSFFGSKDEPYHLGFGSLLKMNIGCSKQGLGNIRVGLTHYRIHSVLINATELVTRGSIRTNINLVKHLQLGIEYEKFYKRYAPTSSSLNILLNFKF